MRRVRAARAAALLPLRPAALLPSLQVGCSGVAAVASLVRHASTTAASAVSAALASPAVAVASTSLSTKNSIVSVGFGDGATFKFHALWLRDHCPCSACRHPGTRQRLVTTAAIAPGITAHDAVVRDGKLEVTWHGDYAVDGSGQQHVSSFDGAWLRANAYWAVTGAGSSAAASTEAQLWDDPATDTRSRVVWRSAHFGPPSAPSSQRRFPTVDYSAYMATDEGLYDALCLLRDYGFVRVEGVPATMEATEAANLRINFARETLYGPGIWRTEVLPGGGNDTAFTGIPLPSHTDGNYWVDPPGIQTFHCLKAAPQGGENVLVDGFAVAAALARDAPEAYKWWCNFKLPYHHTEGEGARAQVHASHAVFKLDPLTGAPQAFHFNNDDRAPLHAGVLAANLAASPLLAAMVAAATPGLTPEAVTPAHAMPVLYTHLMTLLRAVRDPSAEVWFGLQPGTLLIFNNNRVTHGRAGFNTTSGRVLAGAYIGEEDWHSRLRGLAHKLGRYVPRTLL